MKYDLTVFQEPRGVMRILQFVSWIYIFLSKANFNFVADSLGETQLNRLYAINLSECDIYFICLLEQIFAICALYTTLNFEATVSLTCSTPPGDKRVEIDYPFRFGEKVCPKRGSKENSTLFLSADVSSDAQFFVATGVLSLLYSVFIIGVYTMIDDFYRSKSEVPLAVSGDYFSKYHNIM